MKWIFIVMRGELQVYESLAKWYSILGILFEDKHQWKEKGYVKYLYRQGRF
jgi:hypothetical protein